MSNLVSSLKKFTSQINHHHLSILILILGIGIGLAYPLLANPTLQYRYDNFIHFGLVHDLKMNGITFDNPFFSGNRLGYPFFSDYITAIISNFTGQSVWTITILENIFFAVVLVIIVYLFVRSIGLPHFTGITSSIVVFFGLNAFGCLFFILSFLHGEYPLSDISYTELALLFSYFDHRLFLFASKYLVSNSLPLVFIIYVMCILSIVRIEKITYHNYRKAYFWGILLGLLLFLLTITQLIVAFSSYLLSGIAIIINFLGKENKVNIRFLILKLIPLFFSGCISLVWFLVTNSHLQNIGIAIPFSSNWQFVSPMLLNILSVVYCFPFLIFLKNDKQLLMANKRILLVFIIGNYLLSWFIFPGFNQYKFIYLLHIPLSILTSVGITNFFYSCKKRSFQVLSLVIVSLPILLTNIIGLNIISIINHDAQNQLMDRDRSEVIDWVAGNTSPDAIFLEHPEFPVLRITSFVSRRSFVAFPEILHLWGYDINKITNRVEIAKSIIIKCDTNLAVNNSVNYIIYAIDVEDYYSSVCYDTKNNGVVFENGKYIIYQIKQVPNVQKVISPYDLTPEN